jgi:hypothetical protein
MGWFNNTPTANRIVNSGQVLASAALIQGSAEVMDRANAFVQTQKTRAEGLTARAYATQGASSELGRQLQRAINDLSAYLVDGRGISEDINNRMPDVMYLIRQFDLPRAAREINVPSKRIADAVLEETAQILNNVQVLSNRHESTVRNAVGQIDRADRQINGGNATVAIEEVPRFS